MRGTIESAETVVISGGGVAESPVATVPKGFVGVTLDADSNAQGVLTALRPAPGVTLAETEAASGLGTVVGDVADLAAGTLTSQETSTVSVSLAGVTVDYELELLHVAETRHA